MVLKIETEISKRERESPRDQVAMARDPQQGETKRLRQERESEKTEEKCVRTVWRKWGVCLKI